MAQWNIATYIAFIKIFYYAVGNYERCEIKDCKDCGANKNSKLFPSENEISFFTFLLFKKKNSSFYDLVSCIITTIESTNYFARIIKKKN